MSSWYAELRRLRGLPDTLYAESTLFSKRESKSRLTQGIVMVCTRGINQDGVEVMSFERTMLIYKRRHSPEEAAGYWSYAQEPHCGWFRV